MLWSLVVRQEPESLETAQMLTVNGDFALVPYVRHQLILLFQAANENGRTAVDKALRQSEMQGIRQPVLELTGQAAPVVLVFHPALALDYVCPCPHKGKPPGKSINVPGSLVENRDPGRKPVFGNPGRRSKVTKNVKDERHMFM